MVHTSTSENQFNGEDELVRTWEGVRVLEWIVKRAAS